MNKKDLIAIRDYLPTDEALIYSTWMKGLYHGNNIFKIIDNHVFNIIYREVINKILSQPKIKIKVACLKDDPDFIIGYSVMEEDQLHFVFVKKAWRKIGISKDLTEGAEIIPVIPINLTDLGQRITKLKTKLLII